MAYLPHAGMKDVESNVANLLEAGLLSTIGMRIRKEHLHAPPPPCALPSCLLLLYFRGLYGVKG